MSISFTVCPKCHKVNKVLLENAEKKEPKCGSCGASLSIDNGVTSLSSAQVKKLIEKSPIPVVVDFWAPWCGPCRAFVPTFSSAANDFKGQFVFVKVNTEEDPSAGQQFGIRGIPTIAFFSNGQEVDRQTGTLPKEYFKQWLKGNNK